MYDWPGDLARLPSPSLESASAVGSSCQLDGLRLAERAVPPFESHGQSFGRTHPQFAIGGPASYISSRSKRKAPRDTGSFKVSLSTGYPRRSFCDIEGEKSAKVPRKVLFSLRRSLTNVTRTQTVNTVTTVLSRSRTVIPTHVTANSNEGSSEVQRASRERRRARQASIIRIDRLDLATPTPRVLAPLAPGIGWVCFQCKSTSNYRRSGSSDQCSREFRTPRGFLFYLADLSSLALRAARPQERRA